MSEITNTATIKVVADATGVEAGLRQATDAAHRAGQAVAQVGNGASASTRAIETAQRSIIASIQRTTTAMEAGGRSTAAYYELLARQKGVDSNVLAPYIAQLRAVEEAQTRAAQAAAAQQAAQQQATESSRAQAAAQRELAQAQAGRENFLAGLREQISLFGRSTEEVLRFRAAQADAAQAAAPLILQLQNMRAAQEQAEAAARAQAAAQREAAQAEASRNGFLDGLREQIALFGRSTEEVLQYRAAQLGAANAAAPLLAQLRALRDAQEQTAAAARAAEQAQRDAQQAQGTRDTFLAGLREQIALFGKSTDETLRYQAAQIGAASAAEPLIQQLRTLRDVQDQATAAARAAEQAQRDAQQIQGRRDSFLADLREQIALYGLASEEVQRYRAAQLGLANVADPLISQLRALRTAEEQAAAAARANEQAQREAAQVQAGKDNFVAGLREQIALFGLSTDEALRYRAAQLGVAAAAEPLIAQLQAMRIAQEQVTAAARAQAEAQRAADQAQAGKDSFIRGLEQQAQAIGKTRLELLELQAAQMGVTTQARPFLDQLRAAEQSMQNNGMSAAALAAALRGVPAQFTDIIVSLQGGQAPLTVLLQQGGQLKDMFGGAGNAAKALGSYVLGLINPYTIAAAATASLAYAYKTGHDESIAYARALAQVNNIAGVTTGQLSDMARAVGDITGSQHEAAEVLATLAGTGAIAGAKLQEFGAVAIEAQHVLKKSVEETAAEFSRLGKSPLTGLQDIGDKYHFITAETYAAVKAAQEQGRAIDAANIAQQAYADGISKQRQKVLDSLSDWERGWLRIKKGASSALDAFIDFALGREQGNLQKINGLLEDRAAIEENLARAKKRGLVADEAAYKAQLDANERAINAIRQKDDKQRQAANSEAARVRADELRKRWLDEENIVLSRQQLLKRDLAAAQKEGLANGLNEVEIQNRLAVVRRKYNDVYVQGIDTSITALRRRAEVESAIDQRALAQIEAQRAIGAISDEDAVNRTAKIEIDAMDRQKKLLQEQLGMTRSKINSQREQADLEGQIAVASEQRRSRVNQQESDLLKLQYARQKAVDDLVKGWDDAAAAESDAAAVELGALGKTAQARQVLAAQFKLEADARKFVDSQIEAGRDLNTWELAMLEQKLAARKESLAVAMNERAAVAGAQELLEANRQFGIEYIAQDQQRAMAQLAIDAAKWQELIRNTAEGSEAQKALQQQYDTWYQNQLLKPQLDAQKKIWDSVEQTAHDTFVSIFDSGKSAFDRLRDALKNGLLDLLYQMTLKPWIISVQADTTGSILGSAAGITGQVGSGSSNPLETLMSASNLANAGSKAWSAISGGFAGLSDAVAGGVQSALSAAGYTPLASQGLATAGGQALTPLANGAGVAAGYLGGAAVGIYGGRALSGGYGITGSGNGVVNVATIAGAIVGGPIGAAIGGLIGGAANRLFGRKAPEVEAQGIRGVIGYDGDVSGQFYKDMVEKGGVFRSDKRYDDDRALNDQEGSQIGQAFLAITDASSALAKSLGLGSDALSGYTKAFDIAFTDDAAKNQEAIAKFFGGVADEVANKLVPNLAQFSQTGEAASATLQRLAGEFDATTTAAQNIGKTAEQVFGSIGLSSAASRERLVQLAGGTSSLTSLTGSYAQNFLSEAERLAPVTKALDEALGKLGLSSIPTTRAEFKKLIDGFDLTNEAQAKQFVSLIQLGDAFALVHPATEDAAESAKKAAEALADINKGYQDQIDELVKAGLPAAEVRAMEIAGMDASTVALYDRLKALQKEASVAEERKGLQDQLDELTMTSVQLLEKQRAALDESNRALFDQIQSVKALKDAASTLLGGVDNAFSVLQKVVSREKDILQDRIDKETEAVNRLKSLSDSIQGALDGMNVPGAEAFSRQAAQSQIKEAIAAVKGGAQLSDAQIKSLGKALGAISQDSSKQFGSKEDYLFDFLTTRNDIAQLGDLTGDQLSTEEKSLQQLQDQSKALDATLAKAQEQIDILKGISTTGLSIQQALTGFQSAIVAAQGNPYVAAGSAINSAYQTSLGRAPDAAGMEYWQNLAAGGTSIDQITNAISGSKEAQIQKLYKELLDGRTADAAGLSYWLGSGSSISEIAAAIKGSDEYKKLHPFAIGTNRVPEDMPAYIHKDERIIPAADNRELMRRLASPQGNNEALAEAVKDLKAENAQQRGVIEAMAKDMAVMARILKGVSPNETFFKVKSN